MAFVVERIPEEEKQKIEFSVDTQCDGTRPTLSWWAVDRDRDAYIVLAKKEGGAYEGTPITEQYALCWRGELIRIIGDPLPATYSELGATMHWRIRELKIPSSLNKKQEEVIRLVKEAFRSIGRSFDGHRFIDVDINFN